MNSMLRISSLTLLCLAAASCGNRSTPSVNEGLPARSAIPFTRVEILDEEGAKILDSTAKVDSLGGGFSWTEGPLYIADGNYLLFSDIPANKVHRWKEGEGITVYLDSSGASGPIIPKKEPGSNGLLLDAKGNLVLCQHGDRRMARMVAPLSSPRPVYETLADRYMGKRLNSPNDAVYHANGDLYFTDPPYGLEKGDNDPAKELEFHGVYRLKPGGQPELVTREFRYPNGIGLSPDGRTLYVAHSDSENMTWMKYELGDDGLIRNKSVFYKATEEQRKLPGAPDGLKVSKAGYVFATGPGGIMVFNPAGKLIGRVYTGQATANCALSADEKTLFMTCDDFLYRVKLK